MSVCEVGGINPCMRGDKGGEGRGGEEERTCARPPTVTQGWLVRNEPASPTHPPSLPTYLRHSHRYPASSFLRLDG